MDEKERENTQRDEAPEERDDQPAGAIFVTTFLAVVILVSWFAVYAMYMARS